MVRVKFVISDTWVNFYQFAQLFKDQLHCDNALFLDGGTASALYSENLERSDNIRMGAMLVVSGKS
ncbi:phosphodiester glycosidase family protein [Faucicola atlantae]|uniref:phosphodiester glycosidase family protein n=1 Tax=Faucicola atlantae TaxID=34059 RepID=UPI0025AEEEEA|nr:phosphodiester glycosidase family protein [Moraxella atlantae]